jgi:hypothetical protein
MTPEEIRQPVREQANPARPSVGCIAFAQAYEAMLEPLQQTSRRRSEDEGEDASRAEARHV